MPQNGDDFEIVIQNILIILEEIRDSEILSRF